MADGTHGTAAATNVLHQINDEKAQASAIIGRAIEGSWVGYANAMGLLFGEKKTYETRHIVTMQDLRVTLRQLCETDRLAAFYFITLYTRDVLYSQVLWGTNHQAAVEDYVMMTMNATFAIPRTDMTAGQKTCVGSLYAQIYNRKKQTLHKAVIPDNVTVAVGMNGRSQSPNWKRPKATYFIHTAEQTTDNTTMHMTKKVGYTADRVCATSTMNSHQPHVLIDGYSRSQVL